VVTIRTARLSDTAAVSALTAQLGYTVDPAHVEVRLGNILARPGHLFLVAEVDGRAIGWIHATRVEYIEADPFVVIGGLVVERTRRSQGVGRLLLEQAERWAAEHGCFIVRLWSSASRRGAHRFYEAVGYTRIKTQYSFAKSLDAAGTDAFAAFVPRVDEEPET
jgi:GNAT superfamily N-acetyltransferase